METTHLHEYIVLANHGSFTAAARELHITQSTLSKHIAQLERDFGSDLFIRDKTGIKLTKAGEALLVQAIKLDKLLRETYELVRGIQFGVGNKTLKDSDSIRDTALRSKCTDLARRSNLSEREVGALILYLEERGLGEVQKELNISRDEAGELLGQVYRKLGVYGKQEILDLIYSISE